MKYSTNSAPTQQKEKENLKQNVLNIINIVKKEKVESPKQGKNNI